MQVELTVGFKASSTMRFDVGDDKAKVDEKLASELNHIEETKTALINELNDYIFGSEAETIIEDFEVNGRIIEGEDQK